VGNWAESLCSPAKRRYIRNRLAGAIFFYAVVAVAYLLSINRAVKDMQNLHIQHQYLQNDAAPLHQQPLRILVGITSFGKAHDTHLRRLVEEYRSMPAKIDIVVFSNVEKTVPEGAELIVGLPTKDPWSLPFAHKPYLADRVGLYDLFIYSEDDILLKWNNIEAFLRVSPQLLDDEIAGFLLYEELTDGTLSYCGAHSHFHWDPNSAVQRGNHTFAFFTNEHAAFYILNQAQLRKAIQTGRFLTPPRKGRYDMACTASTDPYTQCFKKLICISHLEEFQLHHVPNKYIGTRLATHESLFKKQVEALLQTGPGERVEGPLMNTVTRLPEEAFSKSYYEPACAEVLEEILQRAKTVLSLGCGSGEAEKWLANRGASVTAVCLDRIVAAGSRSQGVEVISGDWPGAEAALEGREFDCLYVSMMLHLIENPFKLLNKFGRFIKKGGACVIYSHNLDNFKYKLGKIIGHSVYSRIGDFEENGVRKVNASLIRKWLGSSGFATEKTAYLKTKRAGISKLSLFRPLFSEEVLVVARKEA